MGKRRQKIEEEVEVENQDLVQLRKRNRLLTKRVQKLEEENEVLAEELAVLELSIGLNNAVDSRRASEACERCGGYLEEIPKADGKVTYKCLSPECREKRLKNGQ